MKQKTVLTAAAGGLALAVFAASPALALDEVTFQLDWLPGGDKAPIFVCIEQGFCEQAGLDVTIEQGRGSTEAVTKLATGISDIGVAGLGALMAAVLTEDVPVTAVMSYYNQGPHAFYVLAGSGIEEVADIEGHTVATSPFTSSNVYLPLVLEDVGLSEDDIELTHADPGALGPMLMTGAVDAMIAWVVNVTRYSDQALEAGEEIVVIPWSSAGLDMYSATLMASNAFLSERPDVARRFIEAYMRSIEFVNANRLEAAEAVVAAVPELDVETVEGSVNDSLALVYNSVTEADGLGVFEPERLAATWARVAAAQGFDESALDPETVVDRSFLPGS